MQADGRNPVDPLNQLQGVALGIEVAAEDPQHQHQVDGEGANGYGARRGDLVTGQQRQEKGGQQREQNDGAEPGKSQGLDEGGIGNGVHDQTKPTNNERPLQRTEGRENLPALQVTLSANT